MSHLLSLLNKLASRCRCKPVAWKPIDTAPIGDWILASDYHNIEIVMACGYGYYIKGNKSSMYNLWVNELGERMYPSVWLPLPTMPKKPAEYLVSIVAPFGENP